MSLSVDNGDNKRAKNCLPFEHLS